MRKPRDYDAELKALDERAQRLKDRKLRQLGELVIACGADSLSLEMMAGLLLEASGEKSVQRREGWRRTGDAFFQRARRSASGDTGDGTSAAASERGTASPAAPTGAG